MYLWLCHREPQTNVCAENCAKFSLRPVTLLFQELDTVSETAMFTCRILTKYTFLLLLLIIFCFNFGRSSELYSQNDSVIVLNNSTFADSVHNSKYVWFVEFFSSWCGHCIRFAPTWKKFAADIKGKYKIFLIFSHLLSILKTIFHFIYIFSFFLANPEKRLEKHC